MPELVKVKPGTQMTDELLRRQQRVVAVHVGRVVEVARRSDQRVRVVVHEHRFEVRLGTRADLIFREGAEGVAFVRPLEVVVRREVEQRRAGDDLVARDVAVGQAVAGDRVEHAHAAFGRSADPPQ